MSQYCDGDYRTPATSAAALTSPGGRGFAVAHPSHTLRGSSRLHSPLEGDGATRSPLVCQFLALAPLAPPPLGPSPPSGTTVNALDEFAVLIVGDVNVGRGRAPFPPRTVLCTLAVLADDRAFGDEIGLDRPGRRARREAAIRPVPGAIPTLTPHLVPRGRRLAAPVRSSRAGERRCLFHRRAQLGALLIADRRGPRTAAASAAGRQQRGARYEERDRALETRSLPPHLDDRIRADWSAPRQLAWNRLPSEAPSAATSAARTSAMSIAGGFAPTAPSSTAILVITCASNPHG